MSSGAGPSADRKGNATFQRKSGSLCSRPLGSIWEIVVMDLATSRADCVGIEFRQLFRIMCSHFFQKGRKRWAVVLVQVVDILVVHICFSYPLHSRCRIGALVAKSRWAHHKGTRPTFEIYGKTSVGTTDNAPASRGKALLNPSRRPVWRDRPLRGFLNTLRGQFH